MFDFEKETIQYQLNQEKRVLKAIEKQYTEALKAIEDKIATLLGRQDANLPNVINHVEYQRMIKEQVQAILDRLHSNEYETITQYLEDSYKDAFVGTMYSLHHQDVPIILPVSQDMIVKSITLDTKLKHPLYKTLGQDMTTLKNTIAGVITRGIASGQMYDEITQSMSNASGIPKRRAMTITRTEAGRVQEQATMDAARASKEKGAEVVKQWCSILDGKTRDSHRQLDGQVREVEEPFSIGTKKAMQPHDFGDPAEDCNCRCTTLIRAVDMLNDEELEILRERASYHGLLVKDSKAFGHAKAKDFSDFKKKYLKAAENPANTTESLKNQAKSGIIDVEIDAFTPCLRDTRTGEIVQTTVSKITRKTALKQYNEKTGWNVNWANTPKDVVVYALRVKGNDAVQGLVGIKDDPGAQAVFIHWASTAPGNNKLLNNGKQDFEGVGGHLFAIAAQASIDLGYGGYMHGFASNKKVLEHYIDKLGAVYLGMLHPYHFAIDDKAVKKLLEVYSYEWK